MVGGIINTATHWDKIVGGGGFNLAAFGEAFIIGAGAGALAGLTGGATATSLGFSGFFGGAIAGATGSAYASMFQGVGNSIAFGDPYSMDNFTKDVWMGGLTGGVLSGVAAVWRGANFWTGRMPVVLRPSTVNVGIQPVSDMQINTSGTLGNGGGGAISENSPELPENNPEYEMPYDKKSYTHYQDHVQGHKYDWKRGTWKIDGGQGDLPHEWYFKDYRQAAIDLMQDNNAASFVSKDGYLFKFSSTTGYFGIAYPPENGISRIITFFKPANGIDYWLKQIQLYGK